MWARSTKGSSKMMRLLPRHVEDASSGDLQSAPGGRSRWFGETMSGEIPPLAASSRGSFRRRRETFPDGSIPLQSNVIREEPHPAAHKPFDAEKARRVRVRSDARVTRAHSQTHVNTYTHKRTSSRESERESEREGGNEVGRANIESESERECARASARARTLTEHPTPHTPHPTPHTPHLTP